MRWLSRLVTVVVVGLALLGVVALLRSKVPTTHVEGSYYVYALFRDGSRLATGSPVMIAGVRVGEVTALTIEAPFARVDMKLANGVSVPVDSWITKRSESAFGDSYLEIIPGGGETEGAPTAARLPNGGQITHVIEGGSTDTVLRAIANTMPKIDRGLDSMHDFSLSGRKWASGPLQEALTGAERWVLANHVERPIEAADRAMERLESGTTRAANAVAGARPDVDRTFDRIDRGITSARKQMADIRSGIHDGLASTRDGVDRIDPTIAQLSDVMIAVNEGHGNDFKGRLGRLVNDPELGDSLEDLAASGRDAVASLDQFHSWLGFRAEYNVFSGVPRFYVTAELAAHRNQFFSIELEKDGMGGIPNDQLQDIVNAPQYDRYQEIQESLRFTAQWGKQMGPVRLRAGIKESTFGLGADLLLNTGRLKFSADVFGGFSYTPRVKLAGALEVFRSLYLIGGVDDVLNKPGYLNIETGNTEVPTYFEKLRYGRDYFLGATLQFTDADLALLIRVYGALLVGLI